MKHTAELDIPDIYDPRARANPLRHPKEFEKQEAEDRICSKAAAETAAFGSAKSLGTYNICGMMKHAGLRKHPTRSIWNDFIHTTKSKHQKISPFKSFKNAETVRVN